MDPIRPVAFGPSAIAPTGRTPVERLERITRERDRRAKDEQERRRRQQAANARSEQGEPEDDGRPHIDVRA
jgi:hypothetical protein